MPRLRALALLAVLAVLPAAAQPALTLGTPVTGRLDASDPKTDDGASYDAYTFRSDVAQTVTVLLHADDFDAYLYAGTGTGTAWEETNTDDDGGEGLDSRLVLRLTAGQSVVLRASSVGEASGAYTLSVLAGDVGGDDGDASALPSEVDPSRLRALSVDAPASGTIESGGDALFRLTPAAGTYTIVVETADFDAMLEVGTLEGTTFTPEVSDDDGGVATNPLVVYDAEGGAVVVRVLGFADNAGTFGLKILEGDQSADYADPEEDYTEALPGPVEVDPASARTLRLDTPTSGEVTVSAGALFRFAPAASGLYTIVVDSADFDPMLEVGTLDGTTFTPTGNDDDDGPDLNPLVVAEATAGTPLYARVVGFQDAEGTFTLRVLAGDHRAEFAEDESYDEGPYGVALDVSNAAPVRVGTTRRSVSPTGPALDWDEQRRFDLVRFDVPRAGTYTVAVASDAFDPGFDVGTMQDSLYVVENSDEDAGVGLNAALVLDLTAGPHYLRVISDTLRRGAYTLTLLEGDHSTEYVESSMPDRVDVRRATTVRVGASVNGRLDASDALDLPWDGPTDLYLFDATAGQTLTVDVESTSDVDPYVEVGALAGDVFTQLASDDDSGEGLNASLTFTFERAGRYVLRVSSINRQPGAYTLRLR